MAERKAGRIESQLFHTPETAYGRDYSLHLLEQYKLAVEMADKVSERRGQTNSFLLTANALLLSALSLVSGGSVHGDQRFLISVLGASVAGILLCLAWVRLVRSYRNLNTAKFEVINQMEQKLPAAVFSAEWNRLSGKQEKREYRQLTAVELYVPVSFAFFYVFIPVLVAVVSLMPFCSSFG